MKTATILSLLSLLVSPAFSQLTKEDLRTIIKEEVRPIIKEEIAASEKRTREYIDLKVETINARIDGLEKSLNTRIDALDQKIDSVETNLNARIDATNTRIDDIDKKFDRVWVLIIALIGLIAAAIAAPPIIVALRENRAKGQQLQTQQMQARIDQLEEKLNAMPQ